MGSSYATKLMCLFFILSLAGQSMAVEYEVGGSLGWSPGVEFWGFGKILHVGDILHFSYQGGVHSVTEVDDIGFFTCRPRAILFNDNSGRTSYTITRPGPHYFISTVGLDCINGYKVYVTEVV